MGPRFSPTLASINLLSSTCKWAVTITILNHPRYHRSNSLLLLSWTKQPYSLSDDQ